MRAPDACWGLRAMTAARLLVHLPVLLHAGDSVHSVSGAGIFIRTARPSDRPMVTSRRPPAESSADCLQGTTAVALDCLADLPAAVTTAVHLKPDLRAGSGVFAMADKRCAFS
jgi:hypothetical protein